MFGYLRSLLRLPPAVLFYLLSEMLFGIGVGMAVIFNFHYLALGFNTTVIGIATACSSVAVAIFSYPAGMLADRYGPKLSMLFGCAILVAGYMMTGFVTTPLGLYLAQITIGIGNSFIVSCEFPYIMSLCERKEDETTAYNMLIAAFTLMLSVGNMIGTHLPPHMPTGTTMYQSTIFLAGFSLFLMWVMRFFLPAKSQRVADMQKNKPKHIGWKIVPSRQVVLFVLYASINGVIYSLLGPFENVIMKERFMLTDDTVGYLIAANSFLLFLISLFSPYLMQSAKRRVILYGAFALQLCMMLGMGLKIPVYIYGVFFLGKGISGLAINAFVDSSMMKATLEEERGLHSGLRNLMRSGAGSVASGFGGALLAGGDYNSIYFVTFFAVVAQVLLYSLLVRQQLTRDLQEQF